MDYGLNSDLQGLTPLQCLDALVSYCGRVGMRIILTRASCKASNEWNELFWFIPEDPYYTENQYKADWMMPASRYGGKNELSYHIVPFTSLLFPSHPLPSPVSTVLGVDLWDQLKPPYASWGWDGPKTRDWHVAAQNTGNSILAKNPQWLIFVAGLGTNGWMGSDLGYVAYSPVKLSLPNQLVYETHEWSQEVYKQEYFSDPAYPRNLRGVWKSRWGYLQQNSISPVFIGAFDTNFVYPVPDHQWLGKFVDYMNGAFTSDNRSDLVLGQKGMSWAVGSSDIGILEADFQTVKASL